MVSPGGNDDSALQGALKILGAIAGAGALIAGAATFAGWQYATGYYKELGIPMSALTFSTQEYAFLTRRTLEFMLWCVTAAGLGAAAGTRLPALLEWIWARAYEWREEIENLRRETERGRISIFNDSGYRGAWLRLRFVQVGAIGLIVLVIVSIVAWIKIDHELGDLGLPFIASLVVVTLLAATSVIAYRQLVKTKTDRQLYGTVMVVVLLVVLGVILTESPTRTGEADASRDRKMGNFSIAEFVVRGSVGATPGEGEYPIALQGPEVPIGTYCDEYKAGIDDAALGQYCKLPAVWVVMKNNGSYFVVGTDRTGRHGDVLVIPESRVVRIEFLKHLPAAPSSTPTSASGIATSASNTAISMPTEGTNDVSTATPVQGANTPVPAVTDTGVPGTSRSVPSMTANPSHSTPTATPTASTPPPATLALPPATSIPPTATSTPTRTPVSDPTPDPGGQR